MTKLYSDLPQRFPRIAATLGLILLLAACIPSSNPVYNHRAKLPGTFVDITVIGAPKEQARKAIAEVVDELTAMHALWGHPDAPPLARTNRLLPTGKRFSVAPSIMPLIKIGKRLYAKSNHLINPAAGKLNALWGLQQRVGEACRPVPGRKQIDALISQNIGMDDIEIHGIQICARNPNVQLDFSGLKRGYGIDLAIQRMQEMGIENALVNVGGDLRAIGSRRGVPWRIALRNPSGGGVLGSVDISGDESVFTAGDYVPSNRCNGIDRQHIIDPRTGRPIEHTYSVTVIHPSATIADAAANALFIAGPGKWRDIARQLGVDQVLLVTTNGKIEISDKMRRRTTLIGNR